MEYSVVTKKSGRILVVEDNVVNQKIVLGMLRSLGFQADLAVNGAEALVVVGAQDFDLVFMDCQMPEVDGYEATRRIRVLENAQRRLPIVAMTANVMDGDEEKCFEAGMDEFLPKPVRIQALDAVLRKWLVVRD